MGTQNKSCQTDWYDSSDSSNSSDESEYSEFHLFPTLCTELRLLIWAFAFPGPRVLEIWTLNTLWYCVPQSYRVNYVPFANKEAYGLFLERWSRVKLHFRYGEEFYAIAYFNTGIDTLYIGPRLRFSEDLIIEDLQTLTSMDFAPTLRFLAFEMREWSVIMDTEHHWDDEWVLEVFSHFPKLELFMLVDYDIDEEWLDRNPRPEGEIEFVNPTQIDAKGKSEMALAMLSQIANILDYFPEAYIPPLALKEVLRGGVRMELEKSRLW